MSESLDAPGPTRSLPQCGQETDPPALTGLTRSHPIPPLPWEPPPTLGGFRLLERIGEGGMGIVHRAEDLRLGRFVAVKIMRPDHAAEPDLRARFVREGKAQALVEHPRIVPVLAADQQGGLPYLVMPLLRGQTLAARLRQGMPALAEALRLTRETAEGLAIAHAAGLIHRDIKPGNIWLEEGGAVRLMDFGLARIGDIDGPATSPGQVMGTPPYMSPEQAAGEEVDARTDLYALGCVLRLMLPRKGAVIPPPVAALLARLTATDLADRPDSAAAVIAEVRAIERQLKPRWPLALLATAVVACCGFLGVGVYVFTRPKPIVPVEPPRLPEVKPESGFPPLDPAWAAALTKMTRTQQMASLRDEMIRRNPGFDGKFEHYAFGPDLRYLKIKMRTTEVVDLTPMAAVPGLADLECPGFHNNWGKLVSLEPIRRLRLFQAGFSNNPIRDLSPLADMPLRNLWLSNIDAPDFSPLYTLTHLQELHLLSTSPRARLDLDRLKHDALVDVWFDPAQVPGMGRLRGWSALKRINGKSASEFWKTFVE